MKKFILFKFKWLVAIKIKFDVTLKCLCLPHQNDHLKVRFLISVFSQKPWQAAAGVQAQAAPRSGMRSETGPCLFQDRGKVLEGSGVEESWGVSILLPGMEEGKFISNRKDQQFGTLIVRRNSELCHLMVGCQSMFGKK